MLCTTLAALPPVAAAAGGARGLRLGGIHAARGGRRCWCVRGRRLLGAPEDLGRETYLARHFFFALSSKGLLLCA